MDWRLRSAISSTRGDPKESTTSTYEETLRLPGPLDEERLLLFDGHSHAYRSYYAIRDLTAPDGQPVNALFGFWRAVLRTLRGYPSAYVAVVFDAPGKTFRHELFGDYKATRKPMPDDLARQFPLVVELLEALGIPVLSERGVEGDDVLASLALRAAADGLTCLVSTSDKDMAQIVGDRISLLRPSGRGEGDEGQRLDRDGVLARYGVLPEQMVDFLALVGDASDNVPGVPNVGEKTAAQLLAEFGSLDNLMRDVERVRNERIRNALVEHGDVARLAQRLVQLRTDVAAGDVRSLCRLRGVKEDAVRGFFARVGFRSALQEIGAESSTSAVAPAAVPSPPPTSLFVPSPTAPAMGSDYRTVLDDAALESVVELLREAKRFALDLETTSRNPMEAAIVGIAVSPRPLLGFYIPIGHDALGAPAQLPLERVLAALRPLIESETVEIIGQNLKYDLTILERYGVAPRAIRFDSMIASHLLRPDERHHDLATIVRTYLGQETVSYDEVAGKNGLFAAVAVDAATRYAAEDAEVVQRLYPPLMSGLRETGLVRLFEDVEIPLVPVLARMERNGILVDCNVLAEQGAALRRELAIIESDLFDIAGGPFNPNSPKQVAEILFGRLKLPVISRTKTGPSTSADVLAELAVAHPLPGKLLAYREVAKLLTTYIDLLPKTVNLSTGRIHTSFHQTSTATGRLSSSDPNLQNVPTRKEVGGRIRQAFVAPAGSVLLGADYSQIELRVLAHLSGDENLIAALTRGMDLHRLTASHIFSVPEAAVTPAQRDAAKRVNFGILYGISPFGLAKEIGTSHSEAKAYIDRFFSAYPGVRAFVEKCIRRATEYGYAETLLGRRRPLRDIGSRDVTRRNFDRRNAVNTPIQGSAADLIKLAMIDIDRRISSEMWPARMLLQIHDELVFEVEEETAGAVAAAIRKSMENVLSLRVPLEVRVSTGRHWGEI
jgi:DNA polymerase-1